MPTGEQTTYEPNQVTATPPASAPPDGTRQEEQPRRRKNGPAPGEGGRPVGHASESSAQEQIAFWQQVSEINESDWENHTMYLYRWLPYYDMTKGGIEPKYVRLYTSAVTIDQIMRENGSGRYNLKLNQKNQNQKSDKTIRQIVFDIINPEYPPNLPDGDWQNDIRNKQWVWGKGRTDAAAQPAGAATPGGFSAKDIRDFIAMGQQPQQRGGGAFEAEMVKIIPALLEAKKDTPTPSTLDELVKLATVLKSLQPEAAAPPPPPDNSMNTFLMGQLQRMEDRMLETQKQFMELLKQKNEVPKTPDTLDNLDKIVTMFGKVADVREVLGGGAAASRMNGWQEVASNVGSELIKAVGPALPFMLRPQQARPAPPQPARPLPPGSPAPNSGVTQPHTAPVAAPASAAAVPEPTAEEIETMDAAVMLAVQLQNLGIAGPLLTYFNDGETGLRFAMWIADGHGAMPLNFVKGQGKEVLLRAITDHMPELYAQLRPNWGKFDLFVDSFLTWTPDAQVPDDDEDDEEEEPITVAQPAAAAAAPAATPSTPKKKAAPKVKEKKK